MTATSFRGNLSVNFNGESGKWAIEWGTSSSLANAFSTVDFDATASASAQSVSYVFSGLNCAVTYWYRGVVRAQNGTVMRGSILSVTTSACPSALAPQITSVSPSSPVGSTQPQPFAINGTGFQSGATVTLKDVTNGDTYADRPISSLSGTRIVINPKFGLQKNNWYVQVINPDGKSSNQFPFTIQ